MIRTGRVFRVPREWSNRELKRFARLFSGDVVNVSGWKDEDKEGGTYRSYFPGATSYTVTNFGTACGFQNAPNEVLLDLSKSLPDELRGRFDVVFNHTTLEHIFDAATAFKNLCAMSRDVVIVVVPFLQPAHLGENGEYSDFWRFSPAALTKMFEQQELTPLHISYNDDWLSSVYVFGIASRHPERWRTHFADSAPKDQPRPGGRAVIKLRSMLYDWLRRPLS
jgi:hypothetical protein